MILLTEHLRPGDSAEECEGGEAPGGLLEEAAAGGAGPPQGGGAAEGPEGARDRGEMCTPLGTGYYP